MTTRIWITKDWYIGVDDQGYVTDTCYQGALGSVVPVKDLENQTIALKVPRMLADTLRENGYIAKVTHDESEVVHPLGFGGKAAAGLIRTQLEKLPLAGVRALQNATEPDALAQDGHVILLSFTKNKPPRFCTVKITAAGKGEPAQISVFPPGLAELWKHLAPAWEQFETASQMNRPQGGPIQFKQPACIVGKPRTPDSAKAYSLNHAMRPDNLGTVWYAAAPAIGYDWGRSTVERFISDGEFAKWNLAQCLEFFKSVLTGLNTLHSAGHIHGDIRPANIMAVGEQEEPDRYHLIDYGSFSKNDSGDGSAPKENVTVTGTGPTIGPASDTTMVGTGIGPQRASPFYSSERRAGTERESADTALILQVSESVPEPTGQGQAKQPAARKGEKQDAAEGGPAQPPAKQEVKQYIIKLGWRDALLGGKGPSPTAHSIQQIRNEAAEFINAQDHPGGPSSTSTGKAKGQPSGAPPPGSSGGSAAAEDRPSGNKPELDIASDQETLAYGDRLRVQDYLFEVIWSKREKDTLLCGCKSGYAKIFHERLALYDEDGPIKDGTVLDLSRYVEYKQWTAASDLYSVGALVLYCLFASTDGDGDLKKGSAERKATVQSRFFDLIEILANVSYFQVFWPQLEKFRYHLEDFCSKNSKKPQGAGEQQIGSGEESNTLRKFAIGATNTIVLSTPHADVILFRCEDNLARFLLIMHFVLSCLHRQSDLKKGKSGNDLADAEEQKSEPNGTMLPFARTRFDPPKSGIAKSALNRMKRLSELFKADAIFADFQLSKEEKEREISGFKPEYDATIRLQNKELQDKLNAKEKENAVMRDRISEIRRVIDKLENDTSGKGPIQSWKRALIEDLLKIELPNPET